MTAQSPVNIAAHLPEMARQRPFAPAVVFPQGRDAAGRVSYTHYTFAQLDAESDRIAAALAGYGLRRGMRTALMVTPSLDFFALTFALFKLGAVPVLIDPGIGRKNLGTCLAEAEPEAFIGIPKAHLARVLFGWAKGSVRLLVTVGRRGGWGGATLAELTRDVPATFAMAATADEETAAILFTSGSTGVPKGAIYSHGNFARQVEALQEVYAIRPGEIDLPTFPLFALFAPALGMTAIIPDMDFTRPGAVDPTRIAEAITNFGVTNMFGSPALIDRVGRWGERTGALFPSLKRVISAGAPVPAAVLERFAALLTDGAEVFTPYGATESLPVCSIGSREILAETRALTEQGRGVCVGRPVPGLRLEIVPLHDEPIASWDEALALPAGEIGEIAVKGPQVTAGYYNRAAATAQAKIADPAGGFFHRMGDVGYRDEQGRVWFCGRKAHRVTTAAGTLFTIPCEGIFNVHPQVYRTALVGVGAPGRQRPVLCVELEAAARGADHKTIARELRDLAARHPLVREIDTFLFHPAFPVDIRHNAKIFREQLAAWAEGELR